MSNGKIDIGVFPTMFGWCVRATYVSSSWIEIDWFCGDKPRFVWGTFVMLMEMLDGGVAMEELPGRSATRLPWNSDSDFVRRVFKHNKKLRIDAPGIPDFDEIRRNYLSTHTLIPL